MKKTVSLIMLALLLASMLTLAFNIQQARSSEPPVTEWNRTFGGTADEGGIQTVIQTVDEGYAVAGSTESFGAGSYDFYLVKTDPNGNMQWNKTYGYGGLSDEIAESMIQTNDGGYALSGGSDRIHYLDLDDAWLVKTDMDGNMQWNKTYGGIGCDFATSVIQASDGGYVLAGWTRSFGAGGVDAWLIKTDESGNVVWSQTYGGATDEFGSVVVQTDDGGYALGGYTASFGAGGFDFWLIGTDADGNMQWNKTYGGSSIDSCTQMVQTSDGGYMLAGYTTSFGAGSYDFYLVKTDANGDMLWNKTYGGIGDDHGWAVVQTSDEGYAIAGYTSSFGAGDTDFWLVKINIDGNVLWNETYGGEAREEVYSVIQTVDGGYAIAGYTRSFGAGALDFWLIKLAPEKISATINIDSDTLNLKSNGEWITCYIELSAGFNPGDIDASTILLNDTIGVDLGAPIQIGDYDCDGIADLMVKFDRSTVINWLRLVDYGQDTGKSFEVNLKVTGIVAGTQFEGADTVKVLFK